MKTGAGHHDVVTEKLPIVKAIGKQVFCCVRMSGMGVALAPIAAQQVGRLMTD
ncbi:MAG: hypothetical protein ABIN01_07310 [Ferruginibacter sp.]